MTRASKAIREARASQIIYEHPDWGRDKVNVQLRKEYGVGLRKQTVDQLKRGVVGEPVGKPVGKLVAPTKERKRLEISIYSSKIYETYDKKNKRWRPPIGHVLDRRPRKLYVDIFTRIPFDSDGNITQYITVEMLGLWTRGKFLRHMTEAIARRRIESLYPEVIDADYELLGYWASKREER